MLGFGISKPEHVRAALESGARGVIVGSAIVAIVAEHLQDAHARHAALRAGVVALRAAVFE
jgi:tryptophan synthase alpha chain